MGFVAASTWDTVSKGASVTLSGSNLIATVSSGTGSVCGSNRISSLCYFEMVIGATLTGSARVGVCNQSQVFSTLLGVNANGCGYDSGGTVKINNTTISTIMTYTANDRIGVAVDYVNQLIWFRKNNGNWNNAAIGSQNPVGAVGGISLATMTQNALSPAWGGSATSSATARFASASWTDTAPTGFSTVDTLTAPGVTGNDKTKDPARGGSTTTPGSNTAQATKSTWFKFPVYQPGNYNMTGTVGGKVTGTVRENGATIAGKCVVAYDPKTRQKLGSSITDGSGNFSIDCGGRPEVYVVAFDPVTYQAIVYDQVVPI